jgi:membrane protease YdiL (CAAX protease family)
MLPAGCVELNEIYSLKLSSQPFIESILLIFPMAVEEIYWRGLLENQLSNWLGNTKGILIAATVYGAVHLWTQSLTLVLAAFIAGLWWCWVFNRTRNVHCDCFSQPMVFAGLHHIAAIIVGVEIGD